MQYQLNISIDSTALTSIYGAGQAVTIVKSVVANPLVSGNLPIAWIEFQPLEENSITWIENYDIYATTTVLQSGASIKMTSQTAVPVQTGWTYTFQAGQFTGASGGGQSTFNLSNMQNGSFSFGLAQQAMVNNVATMAPLNSVPVLYNESATFTPEETVSIFLSSFTNNGVVLSQIASNALTVTLTSQNAVAAIGFNDQSNTFYPLTSPAFQPRDFARRLRVKSREQSGWFRHGRDRLGSLLKPGSERCSGSRLRSFREKWKLKSRPPTSTRSVRPARLSLLPSR